ncbi:T9SS type A sorting domain-containing protein [Flammeovirga sp. SJP92]|uniref:T9SS type A sorting domain-containing protein n=1 Tax=Flammeovirga sp. SJP92 TaxID=1775430 RepID=UPI000788D131|nr:T9SS type A sorting domain-containing protein [Flammeovirga sp. SJP92]KXX72511.1 hypothetical protein AVL50_00125 [Flammeovirga sp. SJP92]
MTNKIHFFFIALFTFLCFSVHAQDVIIEKENGQLPAPAGEQTGFGQKILYSNSNNLLFTHNDQKVFSYQRNSSGDYELVDTSSDYTNYKATVTTITVYDEGNNPTNIDLIKSDYKYVINTGSEVDLFDYEATTDHPILLGFDSSEGLWYYGIFITEIQSYYYFNSPFSFSDFYLNNTNDSGEFTPMTGPLFFGQDMHYTSDNITVTVGGNDFTLSKMKDEFDNDVYLDLDLSSEAGQIINNTNNLIYGLEYSSGRYFYYVYNETDALYELVDTSYPTFEDFVTNDYFPYDSFIEERDYSVKALSTSEITLSRTLSHVEFDETNQQLLLGFEDQYYNQGVIEKYNLSLELLEAGMGLWDKAGIISPIHAVSGFGRNFDIGNNTVIASDQGIEIQDNSNTLVDSVHIASKVVGLKHFNDNSSVLIWTEDEIAIYHEPTFTSVGSLVNITSISTPVNDAEIIENGDDFAVLITFDDDEVIHSFRSTFPTSPNPFSLPITPLAVVTKPNETPGANQNFIFSQSDLGTFGLSRDLQSLFTLDYDFTSNILTLSKIDDITGIENAALFGEDFSLESSLVISTFENYLTEYIFQYQTEADGDWTAASTWVNGFVPLGLDQDLIKISHDVYKDDELTIKASSFEIENTGILTLPEGNATSAAIDEFTNSGTLNVGSKSTFAIQAGINNTGAQINIGSDNQFEKREALFDFFQNSDDTRVFNNEGLITINESGYLIIGGNWKNTAANGIVFTSDSDQSDSEYAKIEIYTEEHDITVDLVDISIPDLTLSNYSSNLTITGDVHVHNNFYQDIEGDIINTDGLNLFIEAPIYESDRVYVEFGDLVLNNLTIVSDQHELDGFSFKVKGILDLQADFYPYGEFIIEVDETKNQIIGDYAIRSDFDYYTASFYLDLNKEPSSFSMNIPFAVDMNSEGGQFSFDTPISLNNLTPTYPSEPDGNIQINITPNTFYYSDISFQIESVDYYAYKNRTWNFYLENIDQLSGSVTTSLEGAIPYYVDEVSDYNFALYDAYAEGDPYSLLTGHTIVDDNISVNINFTAQDYNLSLTSLKDQKLFHSIKDDLWDSNETWDIYDIPSSNDSVVVRHDIIVESGYFGEGEITEGEFTVGELTEAETSESETNNIIISGIYSANAVNITSRDVEGENVYGSLYVDGYSSPVLFRCSNIIIDDQCDLTLSDYATVVIDDIEELEVPIIPEGKSTTNPVININGNISINTESFLEIHRDINWNGTLSSDETSEVSFYGDIISGSSTFQASNFTFNELDSEDDRVININVPFEILDYGSIQSQGQLGINFNNGFSMASSALIQDLGYVTINGDESGSSDVLDLYTFEYSKESELVVEIVENNDTDNFLSLTINDYETVNFNNSVTIGKSLIVNNSNDNKTTINHHGDNFIINYEGNSPDTFEEILSFTNVEKFIGNLDASTTLNLNWEGLQFNKPIFDGSTYFENFVSVGDTVYLVNPDFINISGSFALLAQQPVIRHVEKQLLDDSFVQTDIIRSDQDSIYFRFLVNTLGGTRNSLHEEEVLNIYYNDNLISSASYTIIPRSSDGSTTQEAYGFPKEDLDGLGGFDISAYQNVDLYMALEHDSVSSSESTRSLITYLNIPSGYVHEIDREPLVNFIRNLEFIGKESVETQFNWTDDDLTQWLTYGVLDSLENLSDYIVLNGEGRVLSIDFSNKNIVGVDFTTLDFSNVISSEGEGIILNDAELLSTPILEMEYLTIIDLDENYLDYSDLEGFDQGSFSFDLEYSTPASPFDSFSFDFKKDVANTTYIFNQEGTYQYDNIAITNDTDPGDAINVINNGDGTHTFEFDYTGKAEGDHNYTIVIENTGTFENLSSVPQIEFALTATIENGEAEKDTLFNFLTALGGYESISMADNMRDWADADKFIIDEFGYVTDIDISGLGLTSVPEKIYDFNNLTDLNVSSNELFFDDLDALYTGFTANGLSVDIVFDTQDYSYTINTPTIHHGEQFITEEDFSSYSGENDLTYEWYLNGSFVSDASLLSGDHFTIPVIDETYDGNNLELQLTHGNYDELVITVAEYNLVYALGREDSVALYDLLVEIGLNPDLTLNMREWVDEDNESIATTIDVFGRVTALDLSDKGLSSIPTNLSRLEYLETVNIADNNLEDITLSSYVNKGGDNILFNVDNNQLFFDDIIDNQDFISSYNIQTYNSFTTENEVVTYGDSYSYDGSISGFTLNYTWVRESDNSNFEAASLLNIPFMDDTFADSYLLSVTSNDVANLSIDIARVNLGFTLGQEDSVALYNLFVELGITPDQSLEMRQWLDNNNDSIATEIDNYGRVISLDLSSRGLSNLPANVASFDYLTTVDLTDNQFEDIALTSYINTNSENILFDLDSNYLFFDDIIDNSAFISSYADQTYIDADTLTQVVSYGDSYSFDGAFVGQTLNYVWTKESDDSQVSLTSLFSIDFMESQDGDSYRLNVTSDAVSGLTIFTKQIDVLFTLGQEDSLLLHQMFTEIGHTAYDPSTEFRTWMPERVEIDNYGRVLGLDLSGFNINDDETNVLSSLPSQLSSFEYLTELQLENNYLDFDDLASIDALVDITTYTPQLSVPFTESHFVVQYADFSKEYTSTETRKYSWVFNEDTLNTADVALLEVFSFDPSKEGLYQLIESAPESQWNDLKLLIGEVTLNYQSLISEADSIALHRLFTRMAVDFDDTERIIDWPRMEYNLDGEITAIFLHELNSSDSLPNLIAQFDDLETLKLYNSNISHISDSLWNINTLEYLDLSDNNLFDDDINGLSRLSNLTTLWLSLNNLSEIPDISGNFNLRYFIADDNNITNIGSEFNGLLNLIDLSLAGNNIETITTDFTQLISLKKLDFSRNNLTEWVAELPESVEELLLYTNSISSLANIPNDIIVNIADNILFYDDLEGYLVEFLNYSPQRFDIQYENIAMIQGENYSYSHNFESEELIYIWFKDGVIIDTLQTKDINLVDMKNADAGVYTCFVSHPYWTDLSIQTVQISIGINCGDDLSVSLQTNSNEWFCDGDEIDVQIEAVSSSSDLTYIWYKGDELLPLLNTAVVSVHEAGKYSVKVQTSEGCISFSDSIEVRISTPIEIPTIIAQNDSLTVDVVDNNLQYFWYIDGELTEESGAIIPKYVSGNYTVEVVNESGCSETSEIFTVLPSDIVTNLDNELKDLISLYPQPANQILNISFDSFIQVDQINFITTSGTKVNIDFTQNQDSYEVPTQTLKNGIYLLELIQKDGLTSYHKVLITH